jgi:hypothetical protein
MYQNKAKRKKKKFETRALLFALRLATAIRCSLYA